MSRYEELGVPVCSVNWVRPHAGVDPSGADRVWTTMGQQASGFFILDIDPLTGECRQVAVENPKANYPTATCLAQSGVLYVGAAHNGHLYAYDGEALTDMGAIDTEKAIFPCRIDEDAGGKLWIGSYASADLAAFDPATGTFDQYGPADDVDMYCYPLVDHESGMIACLIKMTQQHVVLFDPETSARMSVGPSLTKEEGAVDLLRGADGRLYITAEAETYVIEGRSVKRFEGEVDVPVARLQSLETFEFGDAQTFLYKQLVLTDPSGKTRSVALDYAAAGSRIFMLHEGPDHRIYGSSILPLHFFSYPSSTGECVDHGKASESGGEAYSMANLDDRIFISSYPAARVSVYDPGRPYVYGEDPESNPRELGRIDEISYRPRTTLTGPLGRVWTASLPDYGLWGGPLGWLDPKTGERASYRDVAGEGSCYTLAHLEQAELIAIGTTTLAGTGTQPRDLQARLILWDYLKEEAVWEGTPAEGLTSINALVLDGVADRLVGTAISEEKRILFGFEPGTRRFEILQGGLSGRPLDNGLQPGPDGLFGFTESMLYRVAGETFTTIHEEEDLFDVPGPIVDGWAYFATNHCLRRIQI